MTNHDEVIAEIDKWAGGSETAHVETYSTWRHNSQLTVRVMDFGPGADRQRYMVEVYDADSTAEERHGGNDRYSLSNPEPELSTAIAGVHWNQFGPRGE